MVGTCFDFVGNVDIATLAEYVRAYPRTVGSQAEMSPEVDDRIRQLLQSRGGSREEPLQSVLPQVESSLEQDIKRWVSEAIASGREGLVGAIALEEFVEKMKAAFREVLAASGPAPVVVSPNPPTLADSVVGVCAPGGSTVQVSGAGSCLPSESSKAGSLAPTAFGESVSVVLPSPEKASGSKPGKYS